MEVGLSKFVQIHMGSFLGVNAMFSICQLFSVKTPLLLRPLRLLCVFFQTNGNSSYSATFDHEGVIPNSSGAS